jgi:hypothetical protein
MAERLVLLVLAGFELLDLEALDGRLAGAGVEFQALEAKFAIDQRVAGGFDCRFVAGQFGFHPRFVLGQFFKIIGERQQSAVTVLENQQRSYFGQHAPCVAIRPTDDKDFQPE